LAQQSKTLQSPIYRGVFASLRQYGNLEPMTTLMGDATMTRFVKYLIFAGALTFVLSFSQLAHAVSLFWGTKSIDLAIQMTALRWDLQPSNAKLSLTFDEATGTFPVRGKTVSL
jgi:hypothetical protein